MNENRRPLSTRKVQAFHKLAHFLVRIGVTPNQVSVLSAFAGGASGYLFSIANQTDAFASAIIGGIVFVQLRLVCNLIDGLMAVESGLKTPTGELYNDVPDRISDIAIFIGITYGARDFAPSAEAWGWLATLGAVMTAYIRTLGASMNAGHFFTGPMAKQHRMFFVTLFSLAWVVEKSLNETSYAPLFLLIIVTIGTVLTMIRRLRLVSKSLNSATNK